MATINNPSDGVDISAIVAAIEAGAAAQVAATETAATASERKVTKIEEDIYSAIVWSNDASNHIAVQPDVNNIRIVLLNTGTKDVYWDTFTDISLKTAAPQYDNVIKAKGSITIEGTESSVGVLLYTIGGNATSTSTVAVNIQR